MQKQRILTELLKSVPIGNPSWPLLEALAEVAGVVDNGAFICGDEKCAPCGAAQAALAKLRDVIK